MLDPTPRIRRRMFGSSTITRHSIVILGHKTSVTMEEQFWQAIKAIAKARNTTLSDIVGRIDLRRPVGSTLSSAIRVFVLADVRDHLDALTKAIGVEYQRATDLRREIGTLP